MVFIKKCSKNKPKATAEPPEQYNVFMSTIADILAKKNFDEPPEVGIIKEFVRESFKSNVSVLIREKQIIITTSSAALAGTLRMHTHTMSKLCGTDKRLVFRIGS